MNKFKGILIIILAVIIGIFGYSYLSGKYEPTGPLKKVSDETAGWKTYTNKEWGFSLKYPENYKYSEGNIKKSDRFIESNLLQIVSQAGEKDYGILPFQINIVKQPFEASGKIYPDDIDEFYRAYANNSPSSRVYIGDIPAVEVLYKDVEITQNETKNWFVMKNGFVFRLSAPTEDSNFQMILSTFKFIK